MLEKLEIENAINTIVSEVIKYTDLVFAFNSEGDKGSFGSGVIISYLGKVFFLTARHVTKGYQYVFAGAYPKSDTKPSTENKITSNLIFLCEGEISDFSIFMNYPLGNNPVKIGYDLENSKSLTYEITKKNTGTLSCAIGYLGAIRRDILISKVCVDTNSQFLISSGPIVEISEDKIVVDMTASDCNFYTPEAKKLESTIKDNNGVFPFYGCSGCGLWVIDGSYVKLLGIMSRKADDDVLIHRVEFVPIWKVINALNNLSDKSTININKCL